MNTSFVSASRGDADAIAAADRGDLFPLRERTILDPASLRGAEAQESLIRQAWRILLRRKWIIAGIVIACLLVGIILALTSQRIFAATVTIEIAREAEQVIDLGEDQRPRLGGDMEFYQTQYALLKSRALAQAVVRDLRLASNQDFLTGYGKTDPETLPEKRAARENMATNLVLANTHVVPVRMSSVVNVRFESPSPEMAAKVANSLSSNFIEFNLARRYEASSYARNFLQNQLEQVRQRLEDSERQAVAYATRNQLINIAPTVTKPGEPQQEQSLVTASLAAANEALGQARTARVTAESRLRARPDQPAEMLTNPTINSLREQKATLSAQYQKLLSDFGPEYPPVKATRAQLAELDRQLATESTRIRGTVGGDASSQYKAALAAENALAARVEQLKSGVLDQRSRAIQYNIFQRDVDTNRALYDALLQRYKEVGIAGGIGANNISIVDRALVPTTPVSPSLPFNILVSLLLGITLGVVAALLLEQFDESAIVPADFQNKLGIPLIGTVPAIGADSQPLDLLSDPKSPMSEAYFSVLTGLQLSTAHGMPKSLLVTSTQPSEGKSTTAYALALSMAKLGKRVLLIDADMRNPSIHKSLGIENRAGLSNLLSGEGTISQNAVSTGRANLTVLTAGPIPPNPAELLAGDNLERVLGEASEKFDHLILDAPPVLGLADAPLLARSVEATVFVLEARRTRTGQARHALHRMLAVRAAIIGAILTKFEAQAEGYGYGYGYEYDYGSGKSHPDNAPA